MTPSAEEENAIARATGEGDQYEKPAQEQELRADLEETWQAESPATAQETEFADEVDGRLGTRHRGHND